MLLRVVFVAVALLEHAAANSVGSGNAGVSGLPAIASGGGDGSGIAMASGAGDGSGSDTPNEISELQTQFADFKFLMVQKTSLLEETIEQILEDNAELEDENSELKGRVVDLENEQMVLRLLIDDLSTNTYTRREADEEFATKVDVTSETASLESQLTQLDDDTYSKTEADLISTGLSTQIDDLAATVYTKTEADLISTGLSTQIDDLAATVYTKIETNARFALQTDLDVEIEALKMEIASDDYVSGDELNTRLAILSDVTGGISTLTNLVNDLDTNTYSKSEVDGISNGLNTRVDNLESTRYTKTEADLISTGLTTQIDNLAATTYTKADVDALLDTAEYVWCTGAGCTVEFVLTEATEVEVLGTDFSSSSEYLTVFVDNAQQSETCDPGVDADFDKWEKCNIPAGTIRMQSTAQVGCCQYTNADLGITSAQVVVRIPSNRYYTKSESNSRFAAASHTHDNRYYTESESDNRYAYKSHYHDDRYYTESESNNRYAYKSHTHDDRYYTESESNSRYAAASHTHDNRYYTESESNNRYAYKSHTHDDRYYTESESNSRYAVASHTHDNRYYTESESNNRYAYKSHTHDDRYYTESESNSRYAAASHTHDSRYYTESESNSRYALRSSFGVWTYGRYTSAGSYTLVTDSTAFCAPTEITHYGWNNGWIGCHVFQSGSTWKLNVSKPSGVSATCEVKCLRW